MDLPDLQYLLCELVEVGDIYRHHDGQLIEIDQVYDDGVACDVVRYPGGPRFGFLELTFDQLVVLERLVLAEWTSDVVN